jgi:hypothetical protein
MTGAIPTRTFATWSGTEPNFGSPPAYIPSLKTHLSIGSFVFSGHQVVRIVSLSDNTVITNEYAKIIVSRPFKTPVPHVFQGLQDRELVQTRRRIVLSTDQIENIAFVFHPHRIETDGLLLHGIHNVFYSRFRTEEDSQTLLDPVSFDSFVSFSSESPQFQDFDSCFSSRIWLSVVAIQDTFRHLLASSSEKQGIYVPRKTEKIYFTQEGWAYLKRALADLAPIIEKQVKQPVQLLLPGCTRTTVRRIKSAESFMLTSAEQMDAFLSVYGALVLFGVRKPRPKIGHTERLCVNDILNVVVPNLPDEIDGTGNTLVCEARILLVMDPSVLTISLSYGRYQYIPSDNLGNPANCPSEALKQAIMFFRESHAPLVEQEPNPPFPRNVKVGRMFQNNAAIYIIEVVNKSGRYVVCRQAHPQSNCANTIFDNVDVVSAAVTEYYS